MKSATKVVSSLGVNVPFNVELMLITQKIIRGWKIPKFQRPVVINKSLKKLAVQIQDDGYLHTAIYLGTLDRKIYLVDGQYRITAFIASGRKQLLVPVIIKQYSGGNEGLVKMCTDFLVINKHIKNPTANDKLRALEPCSKQIQKIRKECAFVGYAGFRRNGTSPFLSMAQTIGALMTSERDVPGSPGHSVIEHAMEMKASEASGLITFLKLAYEAWGWDKEYKILWSPMNMSLCLWFFRRMLRGPRADVNSNARTTQAQWLEVFYELLANNRYQALLKSNSGGRIHDPEKRDPVVRELIRMMRKQLPKKDVIMPQWPKK